MAGHFVYFSFVQHLLICIVYSVLLQPCIIKRYYSLPHHAAIDLRCLESRFQILLFRKRKIIFISRKQMTPFIWITHIIVEKVKLRQRCISLCLFPINIIYILAKGITFCPTKILHQRNTCIYSRHNVSPFTLLVNFDKLICTEFRYAIFPVSCFCNLSSASDWPDPFFVFPAPLRSQKIPPCLPDSILYHCV